MIVDCLLQYDIMYNMNVYICGGEHKYHAEYSDTSGIKF
jgi:hypothetical protein